MNRNKVEFKSTFLVICIVFLKANVINLKKKKFKNKIIIIIK